MVYYGAHAVEQQSLYEISWTNARAAKFAFDLDLEILVDVNPAAEALTGYSRAELLCMGITMLYPEQERKQVMAEFRKLGQLIWNHSGFHIQCKDSRCVPVMISSSESFELDGRQLGICELHDITELKEREHRLKAQCWALSAYAGAALALAPAHTSEDLLHNVCCAIVRESIYTLAWVGIAEDNLGKQIRIAAASGSATGYLDELHLSWAKEELGGSSPTGVCIRTNTLQIVNDSRTSTAFEQWPERARQFGILSSISIPLLVEGGWRGALVIYSALPNAFEAEVIDVFQHLAEEIVHGIHALDQGRALHAGQIILASTQKQLTEALSAMVMPIVAAMEMRDPYTAGHQSRVAEIASAMGKEMGWPQERLHALFVAAQVHDIGKISIPSEILTKPSILKPVEWALMREHPETGYTILKDIPSSWPIAEIVRQHHEKLDGSGYPLGLKGDAILPEAKVLTVADVVEAMVSHRPYRPGIPLEIVLTQIESEAGTQLDAEAVRVCAALLREKRLLLAN